MTANIHTLEYLQQGVAALLELGRFRNGETFKPTQADALVAYHNYLFSNDLSPEGKLKGFFELPTGIGKTALFLSIIDEAHRAAVRNDDELRTMIVVPTTQLLGQTKKALKKWAPDYEHKVGLYGDRFRTLDKELTIITYESWKTLMEEGQIDSSKIDILISDEAHRGTSERSLTNQFSSFANGTAQIAFTATARFDDEKSVEQSHGHQIFSRGIAESIRLGELAAYIQTQLYVIRTQPPEKREEFNENADPLSAIRAGMRQESWMRQMQKVYREGRDEHTGDLLSDNKAGFYVGDIAMADTMAERLNKDTVLQERAREKGCLGVAVSIHSQMPPKLQDKLLEDFVAGKYMACISDSKLKEGFDDPSLKTIFDFPRGSLVDKAQIIGRGARQWFNEMKGRFEGCTFIDTIVYVGSDNKEEDKYLKETAIRNAVMAWSVLEGTEVFVPDEEFPNRGHSFGGGGGVSAAQGLDVESYINLEDLQAIFAIQKRLQFDDTITFTPEMRQGILSEIERTGLKFKRFLSKCLHLQSEVTADYLKIRLNGGLTISESIWVKVMEAYKGQPDTKRVLLTEEMKHLLNNHMDRTGIKSDAFVKKFGDFDGTVYREKINYLFSSTREVNQDFWNWLIENYSSLPDSQDIPLTEEMKKKFLEQKNRTGVGAKTFINLYGDLDGKVNHHGINNILLPNKKTIERSTWEWLIQGYEKLSDKSPKEEKKLPAAFSDKRIKFTDEMRVELRKHIDRTRVGPNKIVTQFGDMDGYITNSTITKMYATKTKTIVEGVWTWFIQNYEALPTATPKSSPSSPELL